MYVIIKAITTVIFRVIPKKRGRICVIDETPFSGSNPYYIYKYFVNKLNYSDIYLIQRNKKKRLKLKDYFIMATSSIFICSHASFKTSRKTICIQTWHGVPLKAMNYLDKSENIKKAEKWHKSFNKADYVLSSSDLYENIMSACIGIQKNKFIKTGFPRNDYLVSQTINRSLLLKQIKIDEKDIDKKIILYIPTFRSGHKKGQIEGSIKKGNIFSLEGFDLEVFDNLLQKNGYIMIAKLHPMEEKFYNKENFNTKNLYVLSTDILVDNKLDIYEVLSCSNGLITDYSSIYFDSLIKDIPIIFLNSDFSTYNDKRGFSLVPYKSWTPGPKVSNFEEFMVELNNVFCGNDYYSNERKRIKEIIFEENTLNNTENFYEKLVKNLTIK
jgi:CDP-glycerol glycerophosphotransferase (TagB/SpsB family)